MIFYFMNGSMTNISKSRMIKKYLDDMYPNVECELNFKNNLELLIAVILSAQCKDEYVNRVTPKLFNKYKSIDDYANAKISDIEIYIKSLGLYKSKSKNIKNMAIMLKKDFNNKIPNELDKLLLLPGVGRKTANVVLSVGFNIPTIAVDTHVERVSKRLGLADKKDTVLQVEKKLNKIFPKNEWGKIHHQLIHFGRYKCKSINPKCDGCGLSKICTYNRSSK